MLDQKGKEHDLAGYKGKWVVLFYPKDNTPGCTQEACTFRDDLHLLTAMGAQVLGMSVDNTASHAEFAKRDTFLIDPRGNVAHIYLKVDTSRHSKEIIEDLKRLSKP